MEKEFIKNNIVKNSEVFSEKEILQLNKLIKNDIVFKVYQIGYVYGCLNSHE